jgi:PilZ domain
MENEGVRRSDRVQMELAVSISGTENDGRGFLEQAKTIVLSRHGAKILISRKLTPDQEVNLRCLRTRKETVARVIGQIASQSDGFVYGLQFLDPEVNMWSIEFVALDESASAAGRVVLECLHCKTRQVIHLDEFEVEVLEMNQLLSRPCARCRDTTMWRPSADPSLPDQGATTPAPRTRNDRKFLRLNMQVPACVRTSRYGEDVVTTVNFSRGGVRYKSKRGYTVGEVVDVSLPYSPGNANIFTPTRILYAEEIVPEGVSVYGAQYLGAQKVSGKA